mmetsp:Transcript_38603/g.102970  ORF Transcript_38603/g.102970 Transcript_38603/m.102970 type:complete len:163 (+) Transcript_38603:128-616(+)
MEISMAYMDMLVRPMDVPVGIAWGCKGMHMPTSNHSKSPLFVKLLTRVARRSADADLSNQSPGLELPIVSRSSRQASGSGSPSHASSSREAHSTKWGKANSTRRAPGSPAPPLLPLLPLPPLPLHQPPPSEPAQPDTPSSGHDTPPRRMDRSHCHSNWWAPP